MKRAEVPVGATCRILDSRARLHLVPMAKCDKKWTRNRSTAVKQKKNLLAVLSLVCTTYTCKPAGCESNPMTCGVRSNAVDSCFVEGVTCPSPLHVAEPRSRRVQKYDTQRQVCFSRVTGHATAAPRYGSVHAFSAIGTHGRWCRRARLGTRTRHRTRRTGQMLRAIG